MPLRIAFFGTPSFAVPTLERLFASAHPVVAVVTQPDRPRGRGHKLVASPVKASSASAAVPVFQPTRLAEATFLADLKACAPDLGVVAAYGRILPQPLLDLPRLGMINVHASLLPKWRGAAPIHRAVLEGDHETGITIMRVVLALDAGPMIASERVVIDPNETSAELERRLAVVGAALLVGVVDRLATGPIAVTRQDDRAATYAARLDRRDSQIRWDRPAAAIHNQIRGLHPWPLATAVLQGRRVLLLRSEVAHERPTGVAPGVVHSLERDAILVATRPGAVRLTEIQLEGRAPVRVRDFLHGRRVLPGDRFEPVPLEP